MATLDISQARLRRNEPAAAWPQLLAGLAALLAKARRAREIRRTARHLVLRNRHLLEDLGIERDGGGSTAWARRDRLSRRPFTGS